MEIYLALLAILAISGGMFLANRALPIRICPICAGVAGTWLIMLGLRFFGMTVSVPILSMLIGSSIIGVAYQLEKRLSPARSTLLFKLSFIPIGFVAGYGVVMEQWVLATIAAALLALATVFFLFDGGSRGVKSELEKKLDECC